MTPETASWMAGVLDAEGSIMLLNKNGNTHARRYLRVRLTMTNTHEGFVRLFHERAGVGTVHGRERIAPPPRHWSHVWRWDCGAAGARILLPMLAPLLIIKAEQAALVLEYLSAAEARMPRAGTDSRCVDTSEWDRYYQRMRELNEKRSRPMGRAS